MTSSLPLDKLQRLRDLCECEVSVTVNEHRSVYESVVDHLVPEYEHKVPADILAEMVKRDTVIRVMAYPKTPISFVDVFHYDLDAALTAAIDEVERYLAQRVRDVVELAVTSIAQPLIDRAIADNKAKG